MRVPKYALISVYDKSGIIEFSKFLVHLGYDLISTGGTAKALQENGVTVIPIEKITGNPESFDGRMKTISFQIESGILFDRKNPKHIQESLKLGIKPIDIVICNFYPFEKTVENENVNVSDAIENIDIGGPTMVRAAAKNFQNVLVIVDPKDYQKIELLLKKGLISENTRQELAVKAFQMTAFYDSVISEFFGSDKYPEIISLAAKKAFELRYGENPHQKGAVYISPRSNTPLKNLNRLWGRELSLVNVTDINAGFESVRLFKEPCAVVIKHNSPCGIALGSSLRQALKRAIEADSMSAFGGVIVVNKPVDLKTAKIIGSFKNEQNGNIDIIASPAIDEDALEYLQKVRKTMGIYIFGKINHYLPKSNIKWINGGFILQDSDDRDNFKDWEIVTKYKPTKRQLQLAKIGWDFVRRIKSNTIIVMDKKLPMTRGIGAGQTSRVGSTKIALSQAGKLAEGAILISDSFFPFDDSVKLASKAKIGLIIEQGGSINDKASIEAANKAKIPMVFTNQRAFWH